MSSTVQSPWHFVFGILGNIVSFLVYLAPMTTFYRIFKKKSTEGFHAFPYVVALLSAMLWIDYAIMKSDILLMTINAIGCFIESIYIALFITYAPKNARILTLKLLTILNFVGYGLVMLFVHLLAKGQDKIRVLGWISVTLSASVFIAPLSIMRQVIRSKSVEFLPFWLSFFLVLSAVVWFFYGLLLKDLYIAVPNTVGFVFGLLQIILYLIYKKSGDSQKQSLPTSMKPNTLTPSGIHPVCSLPNAELSVQGQAQSGEKKADVSIQV